MYLVQFRAFKTGEWYTKTRTESYAAACSVMYTNANGRDGRVIDDTDDSVVNETEGDPGMYASYGN